jgi:2-C-methyl-D-erythritol 4-phosphate cytidylyltransferase
MGAGAPKPFLPLAGRSVLEHTLAAFAAAAGVEELVLVAAGEHHERILQQARALFGGSVVAVEGGAERTDSVRAGVAALSSRAEVVLVHDAARPLVRAQHIEAVASTAAREGAALLAVPVRDTIKEAREGASQRTLDRSLLWAAQTPQGFRIAILRELLERALADDGFTPTDDSALHERYLGPVPLVEGDPENLKLTTPSDLAIAEAILTRRTP